jgi:hypothetical protein
MKLFILMTKLKGGEHTAGAILLTMESVFYLGNIAMNAYNQSFKQTAEKARRRLTQALCGGRLNNEI